MSSRRNPHDDADAFRFDVSEISGEILADIDDMTNDEILHDWDHHVLDAAHYERRIWEELYSYGWMRPNDLHEILADVVVECGHDLARRVCERAFDAKASDELLRLLSGESVDDPMYWRVILPPDGAAS